MTAGTLRPVSLDELEGSRVLVTGYFEKTGLMYGKDGKENKTILIQDAVVHADGKDIAFGHVWVQNSPELYNLGCRLGDKAAVAAVLPHLAELVALSEKAGGPEKLSKILNLFV